MISNKANLTSVISTGGELINSSISSNTVVSYNINADCVVSKTVKRDWAVREEILTITATFFNNTDFNIENVSIHDTLSGGATFVEKSLKIGSQNYEDLNPITGFVAPVTVGAFSEMEYSFDIKISENEIYDTAQNQSKLSFNVDNQDFSVSSNTVNISILTNSVTILKQCDKMACKQGEELTYTITITNEGTLLNTNLVFVDNIPIGTTFVENSVKIDGAEKPGENPENGINLSNLDAGDSIVVEFKIIVN